MKHLLSLESLTAQEILAILDLAVEMKATRGRHASHPLRHTCWGMIFMKSSTRTRVSFEVASASWGAIRCFSTPTISNSAAASPWRIRRASWAACCMAR